MGVRFLILGEDCHKWENQGGEHEDESCGGVGIAGISVNLWFAMYRQMNV